MHSHGDDLNSSGGESDGLDRNGGGGGGQGDNGGGGDMDSKRRRRLELNRKVCLVLSIKIANSMSQGDQGIGYPVPLSKVRLRCILPRPTIQRNHSVRYAKGPNDMRYAA